MEKKMGNGIIPIMDYDLEILLNNIEKRMKARDPDLTPIKLAKAAGLKSDAVRDLYRGHRKLPGLPVVMALANFFGCSIDELVYDRPPPDRINIEVLKDVTGKLIRSWQSMSPERKEKITPDDLAIGIVNRYMGEVGLKKADEYTALLDVLAEKGNGN